MSLTDAITLATDSAFKPLLAAQLMRSALNVYSEDPSTDNHAARARLAVRVINGVSDQGLLSVFAWAISTNDTIAGEWVSGDTDGVASDLAFAVASVWDAVADAHRPE